MNTQIKVCWQILFNLLIVGAIYAQAPYAFNYQGLARDASGTPIEDSEIALRISIVQTHQEGSIVFAEEHEVQTNDNGVFALRIGEGFPVIGNLRAIDWASDVYFIRTEMDVEGGTDYIELGATQMYSVPYALYAAESAGGSNSIQLLALDGPILSIEDGNSIDLTPLLQSGSEDADADPQNELQTLSYDDGVISISQGNSISIPSGGGGTDDQTLSLSGTVLAISEGNNVDLSLLQDGTIDADADPNNELQSLSFSEGVLSISNGNSISIPSGGGGADDQTLNLTGNVLSISEGNSVDLSALIDEDETIWTKESENTIAYNGIVRVLSEESERKISMSANVDNSGSIELYGDNGEINFQFTSLLGDVNNGIMAIGDAEGNSKVQNYVDSENSGSLWLAGENGNSNIFLSSLNNSSNNGWLGLYNSTGNSMLRLYVSDQGNGELIGYGANGNTNVYLGRLNGAENNGYIAAHDTRGDEQAGMYVNNSGRGVLFADVKNFRMDHPTSSNEEIVYASIEGPEVAAYVRGTSELVNGVASITFPDHFKHVISGEEGMTIIVTPRSAESKGLAVTNRSSTGFLAKELFEGKGNYKFDWEVRATRSGYEDYMPIQRKVKPEYEQREPVNSEHTISRQ